MTDHAAQSPGTPSPFVPSTMSVRESASEATAYWWLWLVAGIAWLVASLIILQFDSASVTTVGIIVGVLFTFLGVENLAVASVTPRYRWLPAGFGILFLISAVICFVHPEETFAGMADILGFLFLTVALWWMVQAFMERPFNPTWWVGLISGIIMTGVAFWTAGQFFAEKVYILLVFAGIWALCAGITDIVRAFEIRGMHKDIDHPEDAITRTR